MSSDNEDSGLRASIVVVADKEVLDYIERHKAPLGVMPKWLWDEIREGELLDAVNRYREAGKTPPKEWGEELTEIRERRK